MASGRWTKRLKRTLRYWLIRATLVVVSLLPLAAIRPLGRWMGTLACALFAGERRKALESLEVAFPQKSLEERGALVKAMFVQLAMSALELALIDKVDPLLEQYVELPAEERSRFEAALALGKGLVFVSGHIGNWELLARRFSRAGYSCATIAKESNDPKLTGLIERVRARGKLRTIWRGAPGAAKDMLRQLKSGGVLGLLIDQDTQVQGVFVDFFGRKAFTPRAAADLALRSGAAPVVGFIHRKPEGGHRIEVKQIERPEGLEGDAAVIELTQRYTAAIEDVIRRHPDEWVWMHRRWKTRPAPSPAATETETAHSPSPA
jgi:KDO2-lipid IV(A) lauroyltransferase